MARASTAAPALANLLTVRPAYYQPEPDQYFDNNEYDDDLLDIDGDDEVLLLQRDVFCNQNQSQ